MTYHGATYGFCPLCAERVLFVRSSKGALEALEKEPTKSGWIHIEEGLTHVFDDRVHAVVNLRQNGFRDDQINLYELHYCDG